MAGGLYLIVDLLVGIAVFTLLFLTLNNILLNNADGWAQDNPNKDDLVNNRILGPWKLVPIAFVLASIMMGVYGRGWVTRVKSLVLFSTVTCLVFLFLLTYDILDYWVVTVLPDLIPAGVTQAVDFVDNIWLPLWNFISWGVVLAAMGYAVLTQTQTPEGEVYSGGFYSG